MRIFTSTLVSFFFASASYADNAEFEYPKRPATALEYNEHCSEETNPQGRDQFMGIDRDSEYPIQIMHCPTQRVGSYNCETIEGLIFFEFNIRELFGNSLNAGQADAAKHFSDLTEAYDRHCHHNLS